jgi:type VI secretion system protein ImpL
MKKLFGWIFNPWLLLVMGLLALSLVIWFVGPLLAIAELRPLDSAAARWGLIGAIVLLVVLRKLWQAWRARSTNAKVVDQLLVQPAGVGGDSAADAELKVLNSAFAQALQTLKNARFDQGKGGAAAALSSVSARLGKRYLYELPWYAIIGAPGSGKTTALVNSGLKFPLAATMGEHSVKGVGGTRNCDWWFTDQAVLIDTAGRYTTQTSNQSTDAKAWEAFLGLLKRSRPRQPLNGVLVTVSIPDLLTQGPNERAQHAAAVRKRVQELHQHLGLRFPIYLLVTKADLLAGFMETLGDVDKDVRATPWGFTFRMDAQQHVDLAAFGPEFDALEKRLTDGLIDRLQLERDPQRRARIYAFPQQFEAVRNVLKEFVEQVFSPSQFEAHPLLRGVYFVSGTQEGTPIDRMLGRIARSYKLERTMLPPLESSGKSFFLARLLKDVVFAESGLAGTDMKWERRRGLLAGIGYAAVALVSVAALAAWGTSYLNNRAYVAKVGANADAVRTLVQSTPNRASSDLMVLLPALEATRNLARSAIGDSVPVSLGFGLYQGRKLDAASQQAYRRMLTDAVLPRIALRVEEQLKDPSINPELHYEALKTYVMLYDPARFDAAALKSYVTADWDANLSRNVTTEQRAVLESHLDALLAEGPAVSPLPEDKALVAQTRARLAAVALSERIYRRLKREGVGAGIPEFTVAKAGGSGAALVFVRASGAPLTKGVPGLFTYDGYHKGLQKEVERLSSQLADEESWVLGVTDPVRQARLRDPTINLQVADEVRRRYLTEYAQTWEQFIADVKMVPAGGMAQSVQLAGVLAGPDSPLRPLLTAMSRETTLGDARNLVDKAQNTARDVIDESRKKIGTLFGEKPAPTLAPGARIESIVDDRFIELRRLVTPAGGDKGPAPIDATLALINEMYVRFSAVETINKGGGTAPPSDLPNKAKTVAAQSPEPVRSLLASLSASGTKAEVSTLRETLSKDLNATIGEFCRKAVAGRYPLVRTARDDVTQEDFGALFGAGGLFDNFFKEKLAPYVDKSTRPWSFRTLEGMSLGPPGALVQFQQADAVRETFFRGGGKVPSLRLAFKPLEMDTSITQFILDVDGQLVKYAHGPQIPAQVQWPGPSGSGQVRVALSPVSATGSSGLVTDGPWALFRMFDRLQLDPGGAPERFRVTFNVEGRKAMFEVTASSVRNPFRVPELEQFSCPSRL